MNENNDPQSDNQENTHNQGQTDAACGKPDQGSGDSGASRGQHSDGQGQATGTQIQPDDVYDREGRSADEGNYGGQSKQPGLPDSEEQEWSPGSGTPTE